MNDDYNGSVAVKRSLADPVYRNGRKQDPAALDTAKNAVITNSITSLQSGKTNAQTQQLQQLTSPDSPYRQFIVYLEPCESDLTRQIAKFFQEAAGMNLHTEAHCYHPHISMTGFFDLPLLKTEFNDQDGVKLANRLVKSLDDHIDPLSHIQLKPKFTKIMRQSKPTQQLSVLIDVDEKYKSAISSFQVEWKSLVGPLINQEPHDALQLKRFGIRPKPMDHLSLAYLRDVSLLQGTDCKDISDDIMDKLHQLALKTIGLSGEAIMSQQWQIALYELKTKSNCVKTKHDFVLVHKWVL